MSTIYLDNYFLVSGRYSKDSYEQTKTTMIQRAALLDSGFTNASGEFCVLFVLMMQYIFPQYSDCILKAEIKEVIRFYR